MQLTLAEARKWLQDHNFIELPTGSYFHWIEEDWFDKYKEILSFKNGAYIPASNKLTELNLLDETYKRYQFENYREAKSIEKEIVIPKVEEPKQLETAETHKNANGDPLPF